MHYIRKIKNKQIMKAIKTINMKCGQTYILELKDGNFIESWDVFLPKENWLWTRPYRFEDFWDASDKTKRVLTISTMIGCYFNCQFCASKNTFKKILSVEEILWQVEFMVKEGKKHWRLPNPNLSNEFHILFTRMWEPLANFENTVKAIKILTKKYPHVKIWISTNWWEKWLEELLKYTEIIPFIMLQFSVHWTNDLDRQKLLWISINKDSKQMDLPRISSYIKEFRKYNPRKVSLNFILLENFDYDFSKFKTIFDVEDIYLRLSPLNITNNSYSLLMKWLIQEIDVINKKPLSSKKLKNIINNIEKTWYTYAYAPAIDEEINNKVACWQALEIFKNHFL